MPHLRHWILWLIFSIGLVGFFPLAQATDRPTAEDATARAQVNSAYGRLPMHFEPNQGQTAEAVKYLARGRGYALFLTDTEMVLSLRKGTSKVGAASSRDVPKVVGAASSRDVQTVSSQDMQQPMSPDRPVAAKCRSHRCVAESRQAPKVGAASSRDVQTVSSQDMQQPMPPDHPVAAKCRSQYAREGALSAW